METSSAVSSGKLRVGKIVTLCLGFAFIGALVYGIFFYTPGPPPPPKTDPNKMTMRELNLYRLKLAEEINQNLTQDLFWKFQEASEVWDRRAEREKFKTDVADEFDKRTHKTDRIFYAARDRFLEQRRTDLASIQQAIRTGSSDLEHVRRLRSDWENTYAWSVNVDEWGLDEDADVIRRDLRSIDDFLRTDDP